MHTLNRHLLLELAKVFLMTLVALTLLMLVWGIGQEVRHREIGPWVVLQLIPYLVPQSLRLTIPATALFSATLVFGRLAACNELLALKSLGINPLSLMVPVAVAATGLSLVSVLVNDVATSWGRAGIHRVVVQAVEEILYTKLRAERNFGHSNFSITVQSVAGRKLLEPTVTFQGGPDQPSVTIHARAAELRYDPEAQQLTFKIWEGTASGGGVQYYFDYEERSAHFGQRGPSNSPSTLPYGELPSAREKYRQLIAEYQAELAVRAAHQLVLGDRPGLQPEVWQAHLRALKSRREHLARLHAESYRRWSDGFSTLCFVWVAVPWAILRRNGHWMTTFFQCFAPILMVYYPFLEFTVSMSKTGALPGFGVWGANGVLFLLGSWLLWWVYRY